MARLFHGNLITALLLLTLRPLVFTSSEAKPKVAPLAGESEVSDSLRKIITKGGAQLRMELRRIAQLSDVSTAKATGEPE